MTTLTLKCVNMQRTNLWIAQHLAVLLIQKNTELVVFIMTVGSCLLQMGWREEEFRKPQTTKFLSCGKGYVLT